MFVFLADSDIVEISVVAVVLNGFLASRLAKSGKTLSLEEFRYFWYTLGGITVVALVLFVILFKEEQDVEAA